ncbi:PAS domain-containing protein [Phenylobacterium sp.]|uniref:PAS domain-containing protein n=1 Tax=Phenylobacterium sp. TaxID=1871053 RepID=UPI002E30EAF3|nr:PAS domain-containing protein [Phenylobacterium sp.]HEX2561108.1 PAS domain-containing protein [Phenylobacterium sp.]
MTFDLFGAEPPDFLNGDTPMGLRISAHDWSATTLGKPATWSQSLKTLVGVMLGSSQPMFIVWGPEQLLLYNEAYSEILAERHPAALARPFLEVWSETRDDLMEVVAQAYGGEPVHMADAQLTICRRGQVELAYFSFSYTPVSDEAGRVAGFFCACTETTPRVLAERRLVSEAAQQLRLFEQAPGLIAIARGPELTYEFVNQAYRSLFGERAYIGRTVREVFPEVEGQGFLELLDRVLATGERMVVRHARTLVEREPGRTEELYLDFIYEPLTDEGGQVVGVIFEGHDVTEAVLATRALEASEARFRTALQIETVGAIYFDMEGRLTDANDAFLRMCGYDRADLEAGLLTWQKLTPPEWLEISEQAFAELRATGSTTPYEKEYFRKDGSRWWALFAAKLLPDGTGFEFVLDITDRKRAEAALRESEEDYRYAAELNPQVAWTAAPDGQLDRVAPRWREWTGNSGLGSSYAEGLHPDDVQRTIDTWSRSVTTGAPYDIVHRARRANGDYRWIRSRASPRRDAQGRIVRWYGTTEDIHDQKVAEDHLKLMVLELNHRVKNNLATVQAIAVQTLRGAESTTETREAFLNRIGALAAAHDILTREQWEGVGIEEIARGVLDPLIGDRRRIRYQGPHIRLAARTALSLSMAFHELGTNALKYGALSRPDGTVEIVWDLRSGAKAALALTWTERGGPAVEPRAHRGFGSRLLERGLAAELNGEVNLRFDPQGLTCELRAPLPQD